VYWIKLALVFFQFWSAR